MRQVPRATVISTGNNATVLERPLPALYTRSMKFIIDYSATTQNQSFECLLRFLDTEVDFVEYGILGEFDAVLSVTIVANKVVLNVDNQSPEDMTVYVTPVVDPSLAVDVYI